MYALCCHITITGKTNTFEFNVVNNISMPSSVDTLTDTCTILMPRRLRYNNEPLYKILSPGDQIEVSLGYNNKLTVLFRGYIRTIRSHKVPAELYCEDNMYVLKKVMIDSYSSDNLDIKDFIEKYLPAGIERNVVSAKIGRWRFTNVSLTQALESIKKDYPMSFFFKSGKFYGTMPSTLANQDNDAQRVIFKYHQNIIDDSISQEDVDVDKLQIVAKVILANGTKLETKYPETVPDPQVRTFHYDNITTLEELKAKAKTEHDNFKVNQIAGNFKAFGLPLVRFMDIVEFRDEENTWRDKKSFTVKSVKRTFGTGGYRQEVEILNQV